MTGSENSRRKAARRLCNSAGYAVGGHLHAKTDREADARMIESAVAQHETHDHPGKPKTRLRLADGGLAMGDGTSPRPDRASRGKKGHGTTVNIVMAPQGGQPRPVPIPVPVHGGAPGGMPPGAPLPRPPMPPPGAMPPGGMPMGMPPGGLPPRPMPPPGVGGPGMPGMPMRKAGGRTHRQMGGAGGAQTPQQVQATPVPPYLIEPNQPTATANPQTGAVQTQKRGGRAQQADLHGAGSGSGVGRLNKSRQMAHDAEALCGGGRP